MADLSPLNPTGSFDDRFLSKLDKIDRQEIESFLSNLVREKQFLQVVFNAMLDGIVVLRANLQVLYINNAAVELLGINARRRIFQERIAGLVRNQEFSDLVARFALHREKIVHSEIEMPAPSSRVLGISIVPVEVGSEALAGVSVAIIRDQTEARLRAEERQKTERMATLATLTASLAHEIKNPLNSLQIHAQLLQRALREKRTRKEDRDRMLQSSDVIVEEISRLAGVVNGFLDAVRPTRPLKQRTDINRLVEHVVNTMQPEAERRGIDLAARLDHEIAPFDVDPNQFTQATLNLIKNSLEALDAEGAMARETAGGSGRSEGGASRVEVRTELVSSGVAVRVSDNGPGIAEGDLKHIREPYFTTKFSGTGLGLAIVSRIVEEHGGVMEIVSKPGGGTVVTMVLPLDERPVRLLEE